MKKLYLFLLLLISLVFAGCTSQDLNDVDVTAVTNFDLKDDEQIMALSAITSSSIAPEIEPLIETVDYGLTNVFNLSSVYSVRHKGWRGNKFKVKTIEDIEPYLNVFEKLLNEDALVIENSESGDEEFPLKTSYTMSGITGDRISVELIYNLELLPESTDEKAFYTITGYVIRDGEQYDVIGMKMLDNDEEKFIFKVMLDELNYIRNEYKSEGAESKFRISTIVDGVKVSEDNIKVETQENETRFVLSTFSENEKSTYIFKLENEEENMILKLMYNVYKDGERERGMARISVVFDEETSSYVYEIIMKGDNEKEGSEGHVERDYEDDEVEVLTDELPSSIIEFITSNYPESSILRAEVDERKYEIKLDTGHKLYFTIEGEFIKTIYREKRDKETNRDSLSLDELPNSIVEYLDANYEGYELLYAYFKEELFILKITGKIELVFNELGDFIYSDIHDHKEHPGRGRGYLIEVEDLNESILNYIQENYSEYEILKVMKRHRGYDIYLNNNLKLKFNYKGVFLAEGVYEETNSESFNFDNLPEVIKEYLLSNFPDLEINKIKVFYFGYYFEFKDGTELFLSFEGMPVTEEDFDKNDEKNL